MLCSMCRTLFLRDLFDLNFQPSSGKEEPLLGVRRPGKGTCLVASVTYVA